VSRVGNLSLFWRLLISYLLVIVVSCTSMYLASEALSPRFLDFHLNDIRLNTGQLADGVLRNLERDLQAAHSRAMQRSLLWGVFVALVIASAVSFFVSSRIATPIRVLQRASRRIAAGRYRERLNTRAPGEVSELATAFNEMAQRLCDTEAKRVELLGNVAHEFRTPLSSLRGYVEGLQDGVFGATPETLEACERQLNRLDRLVADLTLLSRVEAGQEPVSPKATPVDALLAPIERAFTPQFTGKGVRLVLESDPPALCVVADPQRVAQVLGNLITNALRHTPTGGEVRVGVRALAKQEVEFRVTDTGNGISPEDLPHVFTRFYRGSKARSQDEGGGSGIGLTIAKSFVEMHGGRIGVENRPGCGSSFWFTLLEAPAVTQVALSHRHNHHLNT
jgi:signal transduction histidine kinase